MGLEGDRPDPIECSTDGLDLLEQVDAVGLFVHHFLDPSNVALDTFQALDQHVASLGMGCGVASVLPRRGLGGSAVGGGIF